VCRLLVHFGTRITCTHNPNGAYQWSPWDRSWIVYENPQLQPVGCDSEHPQNAGGPSHYPYATLVPRFHRHIRQNRRQEVTFERGLPTRRTRRALHRRTAHQQMDRQLKERIPRQEAGGYGRPRGNLLRRRRCTPHHAGGANGEWGTRSHQGQ